ncbi:type IV toxin-antitoxin system AbiEi family antitoxin domain-containing protein [Gordonia rubripertincta]|uniref:Type IV toxin-antitoxin system AbiEi family antitoxin domain-containing protein n=1 Tax=Gordonia rubripertincta TaxID=36822 RepID=A0ABT4MZX3_GORRU|nr:type IV toxin-antitoxin system AbiEi family antitoxin domain-containing protein [Gordonia rubripertincta]MCZ4551761.1 type IV toxin-antitoxin system AbiEi family antitoxin domain-containing protein [Gordonia rubripertincta]
MGDNTSDDNRLIRRRDAASVGNGDDSLRVRVKTGQLIRLYRGFYTFSCDLKDLADHEREQLQYRRTVLGAAHAGDGSKAVSHHSAAVLHGLPLLGGRTTRVHFTANRKTGGRKKGRANVLHAAPWLADEVVEIDGLLVTSLARTAVDLARQGSFLQAVCAFDGVLRMGATRAEVESVLDRSRGRAGVANAIRAFAIADGDAESIGESLSRALMHTFGDIPRPRLQQRFFDARGAFVARTDFDWDGVVVGEFDGYAKYIRYLKPGETIADAYEREKKREQKLARLGVIVIRWCWDDLMHPHRFRNMLHEALTNSNILTPRPA